MPDRRRLLRNGGDTLRNGGNLQELVYTYHVLSLPNFMTCGHDSVEGVLQVPALYV
jgi:hypothetical protein